MAAYWAGLALVAGAIVLIPASYAALVAALAAGTAWHLVVHASWIAGEGAGPASALLYAFLALATALPMVFLLRPFCLSAPPRPAAVDLDPAAEPRLHAFVLRICEALGAPVPTRIRATMDVNASARFAPGPGSVLRGRLELTLGLPLVRGLDMAQFAGVLAHELGHFRQGGAMRLVHLLRAVSIWLARAAMAESAWERRPPEGGAAGAFLHPVLSFARLGAASARRVIQAHIHAGQVIGCVLLRQMERHADLAAIRMVGGETFAGMVLEAKVLETAWGLAHRSLGLSLREGRLADDLPALVAAHTRVFIPEVRRKLEQSLALERSALFDTHPGAAERVAFARSVPGRGLFHVSGPAHSLFSDFGSLSRKVTRDFYRQDLGEAFRPDRMVATADLVAGHGEAQVGEAAITGYFGGMAIPMRPFCFNPAHLEVVRAAGARERLAQARERIEAGIGRAGDLLRAYSLADANRLEAVQALVLTRAGFHIEPGDFRLDRPGVAAAEAAFAATDDALRDLSAGLASFEAAFRDRMASALALLDGPGIRKSMPDAPAQAREARRLVPVLGVLGQAQPMLDSLRMGFHALSVLIENIDGNEGSKELEEQMRHWGASVRRDLAALRPVLSTQDHPFSPAGTGFSLAEYAMEALPHEGDVGGLFHAAEETLERCHALHGRILGRLALAAGRAEGALGFGALRIEPGFPSVD